MESRNVSFLKCKVKDNDQKLLPEQIYDQPLGYDIRTSHDISPSDWKEIRSTGIYYVIVDTGLAIEFDNNIGAMLMPRSGLDIRHHIFLIPKVIDPDYRGTIWVKLLSIGAPTITLSKYTRIAQLVFMPKIRNYRFEIVSDLNETKRNDKGLGSSGLN